MRLHPSGQVAVGVGPERQVQVVRHQAESHHPHRQSDAGFGDQRHEGGVVTLFVIDLSPAISPIDDVIAEPTWASPRCSRHWSKALEQVSKCRKHEASALKVIEIAFSGRVAEIRRVRTKSDSLLAQSCPGTTRPKPRSLPGTKGMTPFSNSRAVCAVHE